MGPGTNRTRWSGSVFEATQDEVDGVARHARSCTPPSPDGGPLDDVRRNARDAGDRHFDETMQRPRVIRLHFVRDEFVLGSGGWRDVR